MRKSQLLILTVFLSGLTSHLALGQKKEGNKWIDDNLTIWVIRDQIKKKNQFYYCVADTSRDRCIVNLTTGVHVKVFNKNDNLLWKGRATGRTSGLKLPEELPQADYLQITAFDSYVINKSTGTHIYQKEPISIKYDIQ